MVATTASLMAPLMVESTVSMKVVSMVERMARSEASWSVD